MSVGLCERCGAYDEELEPDLGRLVCSRCVLPLRETNPHGRKAPPPSQRSLF